MTKQSDRATLRSGLLYKLDWISYVVGVFRLELNLVRRVNASGLRQEPA